MAASISVGLGLMGESVLSIDIYSAQRHNVSNALGWRMAWMSYRHFERVSSLTTVCPQICSLPPSIPPKENCFVPRKLHAFSNNYISSAPLTRGVNINKLLKTGRISSSLDALPVAFNVVFTLSRLSFYGQLLEQLNVASLSGPTVFLQRYSLLLLSTLGKIDEIAHDITGAR